MPRSMGQLKQLKMLSLFVIGKEESDCQLDELREFDISGSLKIKNLGRVSDASIAKGISMAKKLSINKLDLEWTSKDEVDVNETKSSRHEKIGEALEVSTTRLKIDESKSTQHEKIGEALEVSTAMLKILKMSGYKGVNPPKWVGMSSPSVTGLEQMDNVNTIANSSNGNEMIVLFPLLQQLKISNMENMRELVSPSCWSICIGAFPNLSKLEISFCPKLGALPPHLKALKHVTILADCSDELLYSISNLSGLTHLFFGFMEERSVLFPSAKALMFDDGDINEAQLGVPSTFQSLQHLKIENCKKLRRLFEISGCQNQQKHPLQGQTERIRGLRELEIYYCPDLMISVEEFGNLNINNSLQGLCIMGCPKLVSSEEADDFVALLRSLRARLDPWYFSVDIIKE
ncbi:uncharacterized protein LOC124941173 [Impatiens glandulifera]|uniref:uncharacterized protein LOC124941173 n=1 Tax=Impatiens glandulifera TaxID=253017 RepID=UPI001FB092AF|nr:uncharacterized protein LOC124941173 [Impatiens glandulifera]